MSSSRSHVVLYPERCFWVTNLDVLSFCLIETEMSIYIHEWTHVQKAHVPKPTSQIQTYAYTHHDTMQVWHLWLLSQQHYWHPYVTLVWPPRIITVVSTGELVSPNQHRIFVVIIHTSCLCCQSHNYHRPWPVEHKRLNERFARSCGQVRLELSAVVWALETRVLECWDVQMPCSCIY